MKHVTLAELEAGLENIRQSPTNAGVLELIVRRPQIEAREVLKVGELDMVEGLVGDNWKTRGSSQTTDRSAHPDMQLNHHERTRDCSISTKKRALVTGGRSVVYGLRFERGECTAGHPTESGGCGDRSYRSTAYGLVKNLLRVLGWTH